MKVVITMAGEGSRFRKIGIQAPKYEIMANGKTLFEWSLAGLINFFNTCEFVFVARENAESFIEKKCKKIGVKNYRIIILKTITTGQAETVFKALQAYPTDSSILIFNIDTYLKLPADSLSEKTFANSDGWLQLFKAPGNHWSFARLNDLGDVVEVTEKIRISEYASTGLYYFKSSEQFKKNYEKYNLEIKSKFKETYIAPFYQYMIREGQRITQETIPYENVIPLGTPDEVALFDPEYLKGLV